MMGGDFDQEIPRYYVDASRYDRLTVAPFGRHVSETIWLLNHCNRSTIATEELLRNTNHCIVGTSTTVLRRLWGCSTVVSSSCPFIFVQSQCSVMGEVRSFRLTRCDQPCHGCTLKTINHCEERSLRKLWLHP